MKMELALHKALRSINVPEPRINAFINAWESDMQTHLATKSDISNLRSQLVTDTAQLSAAIANVRLEISTLDAKLTTRMGAMLMATAGIVIAAVKYII